jgi:hypothetical protein
MGRPDWAKALSSCPPTSTLWMPREVLGVLVAEPGFVRVLRVVAMANVLRGSWSLSMRVCTNANAFDYAELIPDNSFALPNEFNIDKS